MMSSKSNRLENKKDQLTELSDFKKSKDDDETEIQNKISGVTDNSTTYFVRNESDKTLREINLEIDIFEKTVVFSGDSNMWI